MTMLEDGVAAPDLTLEKFVVAESVRIHGCPEIGQVKLGDFQGCSIGVWEMTRGIVHDVEVDEVFIVLSGRGRIEFIDEERSLRIKAGDVVRLNCGQRTVWTIDENLRKIYVAAST